MQLVRLARSFVANTGIPYRKGAYYLLENDLADDWILSGRAEAMDDVELPAVKTIDGKVVDWPPEQKTETPRQDKPKRGRPPKKAAETE